MLIKKMKIKFQLFQEAEVGKNEQNFILNYSLQELSLTQRHEDKKGTKFFH